MASLIDRHELIAPGSCVGGVPERTKVEMLSLLFAHGLGLNDPIFSSKVLEAFIQSLLEFREAVRAPGWLGRRSSLYRLAGTWQPGGRCST